MNEREVQERAEAARKKALAAEVEADFCKRRKARKSLERGWELNMNFFSGNQYCDVMPDGEIGQEDARFYWQSRRVFNHIAPTVETRCAKLEKNRPTLRVRPFSDENGDVQCARLASDILQATGERIGLEGVVSRCTLWSEVCGTAFYKVLWDGEAGTKEGDGDVAVVPLSPFEVYPDTLTAERMEDVRSLIHAKAVPVREIKETFGVTLSGRDISDFAFAPYSETGHWKCREGEGASCTEEDYDILIERYTVPDKAYPEGRLEIVAGGKLLYEGPLPYINGERGARKLPFVRQVSLPLPGSFFGASVVDRLIPLQRAYNAVRNRKHEFLNRLSMGVVTVEDGSVDTDELAEEGLCPGKILVYRQGSQPPAMLDCGTLPAEFEKEEDTIVNEFLLISGTSEITRGSQSPSNVTSATGLQILLNQEDERMAVSSRSVSLALQEVGRQILKLYKQFAAAPRTLSMGGEGKSTEIVYFNASDISAEDILFDTDNAASPEMRKSAALELLASGLLSDENGAIPAETKKKVLDLLGYGNLCAAGDLSDLHIARADKENLTLARGEDAPVEEYDDHALHAAEHLRYLLCEEFGSSVSPQGKRALEEHLKKHRSFLSEAEGTQK